MIYAKKFRLSAIYEICLILLAYHLPIHSELNKLVTWNENREESMVHAIQLDLATIKGLLTEEDITKLTELWEIEFSSDII